MSSVNTNETDILPLEGPNGDYLRIHNRALEETFLDSHLAISKLINLIELPKGKHRLLPEYGLRDDFLNLPFTDETILNSKIVDIENRIKALLDLTVEINYKMENDSETRGRILVLSIICNQLPSLIQVKLQSGTTFNVAERISTSILNR